TTPPATPSSASALGRPGDDGRRLRQTQGMDLPERLVMTPGQTFSVDLPGLGSAGYLWFAEVATGSPAETLTPTDPNDETDVPPDQGNDAVGPPDAGDAVVAAVIERGGAQQSGPRDEPRPVGASLPETLLITARTPGTATVALVQRRPWESGPPRAERHTQVVVVPAESDTAETLDEPAPSEDTQPERGH